MMLVAGLSIAPEVPAQSDLFIGEIDIPSFRWGRQTATFEVTNNSDWIKYITVETNIKFEGTYLNPERTVYKHYPLEPGESRILTPEIDIPGNYGRAVLWVRLYDVIDTLDTILPGQKVFEQPFKLTFHVPEEVAPYLVANNPIWDNEFTRLLPLFLNEGKSIEEMAFITRSDTGFVRDVLNQLTGQGLLLCIEDSSYVPAFPVFLVTQAEETKRLAELFSDRLAATIEGNMNAYRAVMDSLIEEGTLTTDSNEILHGGTILYRPYPVLAALLLWYDLGQAFIAGRARLTIFEATDPCNALIGQYMYAVQGGDIFCGHHYYNLTRNRKRLDIKFGDNIPEITCAENSSSRGRLGESISYRYKPEYVPEVFSVSAQLVRPALRALSNGVDELFRSNRDSLIIISGKYGHEHVTVAERYWYWNQLATRTLDKLVERGVVKRRGNGQYKFLVSQ